MGVAPDRQLCQVAARRRRSAVSTAAYVQYPETVVVLVPVQRLDGEGRLAEPTEESALLAAAPPRSFPCFESMILGWLGSRTQQKMTGPSRPRRRRASRYNSTS
jgi:hypothetical protein